MATTALRAVGGLATSSAIASGLKSTGSVVTRELRPGGLAWRRVAAVPQQQRRSHQTFRGTPVAMQQPNANLGGGGGQNVQPLGSVDTTYVEGVSVTTSSTVMPGGLGPNADPFLGSQPGAAGTAPSGGAGIDPYAGGMDAGMPMPPTPETMVEALEAAGVHKGDKELTTADARAVQSAESRVTGTSTVRGGAGATAQALADKGVPMRAAMHEVVAHMPVDKVVTQEDASKVQAAEQRNNQGQVEPGGVAASVQQAANYNKSIGAV